MTAVYRLLNTDGDLLYVGVTDKGMTRMTQHVSTQPWWAEVVTTQWETHETREAALMAEEAAIAAEQPRYNIAPKGRGRPPIGPPFYVRLPADLHAHLKAEAARRGVTMAEQLRRILTERYEKETTT